MVTHIAATRKTFVYTTYGDATPVCMLLPLGGIADKKEPANELLFTADSDVLRRGSCTDPKTLSLILVERVLFFFLLSGPTSAIAAGVDGDFN